MRRWGQVVGCHRPQSLKEHIGSTLLDISGRFGGESLDTVGDNFGIRRRLLLQPQLGEFDIHWRRPDCSKMMAAEEGCYRSTNPRTVAIPLVLQSVPRRQFRG